MNDQTAPLLVEGDDAPDFTLPRDGGEAIELSRLRGQNVALYFYPKDDTSGCTLESLEFSALTKEFEAARTVVIGLSPDPTTSHAKFRAKHDLTQALASDESKQTLLAYGVWVEKSMYGRKYMGVERSTFLIDKAGKIAKIWRKVKAPGHAAAVLKAAQSLN
jgi:peroxiredoxin Q/BCP